MAGLGLALGGVALASPAAAKGEKQDLAPILVVKEGKVGRVADYLGKKVRATVDDR
jgi:hypothetical protein